MSSERKISSKYFLFGFVIFIFCVFSFWFLSQFSSEKETTVGVMQKSQGQQLYEKNCSRCHGANANGLGTAPSLKVCRLDEQSFVEIVKKGKGSRMPAFSIDAKEIYNFLCNKNI